MMAVTVGFIAVGQKVKEAAVPAAVKASLAKHYPGVTTKWEKEDGLYEASFKKDGKDMSVMITSNGTITETEVDLKIADLPATVLTYVKEHYKGKSVKEAARITKADGTVNYEAEVNGKDLLFDVNGKFLKEVKD